MADPTWESTQPVQSPMQDSPAPQQTSNGPSWESTIPVEEKYGSFGQQALGAAETAASAATFGVSRGLENALSKKYNIESLSPEAQRGRESQQGTLTGLVSGGVGLGLGALTGVEELGGAAQAMNLAGEAGVKALGLGAAQTAVPKIAAGAVKGFIEGGIFQGGNEVGKMLTQDPDQTVGTAVANMGLAGLFGAGIGGAASGAKSLWDLKTAPKVAKNLESANETLTGETPTITPAPQAEPLPDIDINEPKPNINEIEQAEKLTGAKLPVGSKSGQLQQDMSANLARRPTIAGITVAKEFENFDKKLIENANDVLSEKTPKTEYQVGQELKDGIKKTFEDELEPIEQGYQKLEPVFKSVPVSDEAVMNGIQKVVDNDFVKADPEGLGKYAEGLVKRIQQIENVQQLKIQRTLINKELREAYRSGSPKADVLQSVKDSLTEMRTESLHDATLKGLITPEEAGEIGHLDARYSGVKDTLRQFGVETGMGNLNDARAMLERFNKTANEAMASKLFDLNDVNAMKFVKDNFPEQFELARKLKLKEIAEKSVSEAQGKNGKFEVGSFLRQISDKKLNPEARALLFGPEKLEKIKAIETLYRNVPGNPNPSGTTYAQGFAKLFSIEGLAQNGVDAVQLAFLKSQPALEAVAKAVGGDDAAYLATLQAAKDPSKPVNPGAVFQMANYIRQTMKGESITKKAVKDVFKASSYTLPATLIPNDKSRQKLDEKLKAIQEDPSILMNNQNQIAHYMPEHGVSIAKTLATTSNYLNAQRPLVSKKSPLDPEPKVSRFEQTRFNRTLDLAEQPLLVIKDIKDGSVNSHDVHAISTMYPALYTKLKNGLYQEMMDHVGKGETIPFKTVQGLSLFVGEPLESTLKPESIQAAQMAGQASQVQQAQEEAPKVNQGGMDKMKLGQQAQSPVQAREQAKSAPNL